MWNVSSRGPTREWRRGGSSSAIELRKRWGLEGLVSAESADVITSWAPGVSRVRGVWGSGGWRSREQVDGGSTALRS